MFENRARVLLVLSQDVVDEARVVVGKATTALKMPVSLQIVLRALIVEGLRRVGDRHLLANIEGQARAVRRIRILAGQGGGAEARRARPRSGALAGPSRTEGSRGRGYGPAARRIKAHA